VPARRIDEIGHGRLAITADTAMRLAPYFSTDAVNWMASQSNIVLEIAGLNRADG